MANRQAISKMPRWTTTPRMLTTLPSVVVLLGLLLPAASCLQLDVIYAVNAGGEAYTDSHDVHYMADPLLGKDPKEAGTASSYGKQLLIGRVEPDDQILYQTERYHDETFGYDIPVPGDGHYVLLLKFCEVYFNSPNMKVFDVVLNGDHTILADLDIYDKVGRGVAHDEYIQFSVQDGKLLCNEQESEILGGKIRVEFIKGYRDNPKINAIAVIRGTIEDVPKLKELEEETEMPEEVEEPVVRTTKHTSGPRTPDPYAAQDSSILLPVFIAIGAFIPLLFCLCKL